MRIFKMKQGRNGKKQKKKFGKDIDKQLYIGYNIKAVKKCCPETAGSDPGRYNGLTACRGDAIIFIHGIAMFPSSII